jgi:membrane protein
MTTRGQRKAKLGEIGKSLIKPIEEFIEDDMTTYAAALAYQTLFSLFPFVLFLVALLGFLQIPAFFDWLLDQARTVLPEQAMGIVEQVIGQIRGQSSGGLLSLGIIIALWAASSAVRMLMNALNAAYDVAEDRPAWKRYLLSIFYTIVLAVVIILAVGLMLVGPQVMEWLADQIGLGPLFVTLWAWLRLPVAILLLMVVVALVYYLFPNVDQPFRFITPGSVLAVVVWIAASFGFSFYVSNFASYSATYGSLGAVIVLLLYFFVSAAVLLFGAEVNAQIYYRFAEDDDEGEEA